MAEVSRQEFADMCGIDMDSLRSYISRKQVIVCGDKGKLIETTNPINKAFRDKRKAAKQSKQEYQNLIAAVPLNPRRDAKRQVMDDDGEEALPDAIDPEVVRAFLSAGSGGGNDGNPGGAQKWLLMKMKGDAELVSIRVEKEQLLLDKAAGKLVPMDVVSDVLRSHAKAIFVNFENSIKNIATVFCNVMANGDMEMYTRIVEEADRELSTAINRAGSEATNELDNILSLYADSRGNKL